MTRVGVARLPRLVRRPRRASGRGARRRRAGPHLARRRRPERRRRRDRPGRVLVRRPPPAAARWPRSRRRWPPSRAHADAGGPVLGVCNGFQVLTEAGLLPGVLRPNASLRFRCHDAALVVERDSAWLPGAAAGDRLSIPIKHHDGGWYAPARAGRRARAARPGAAPLRPEPQRLRRVDRVRHERARQRRRAHAAPRACGRRAARIDRRPPAASGAARPGPHARRRLALASSRSVRQKSESTNATNAVPASA